MCKISLQKRKKPFENKHTERTYGKLLNYLTYLINLARKNKMHSQF